MGFFLHLLLLADKYQPTKVLKADVELMASADLSPIRGVDIICGTRGQAASALQCWCPNHPLAAAIAPKDGTDQPLRSGSAQKNKRGASVVAEREKKLQNSPEIYCSNTRMREFSLGRGKSQLCSGWSWL